MSSVRDLDSVLTYLQLQIKKRLWIAQELIEVGRSGLPVAQVDEMQEELRRDDRAAQDRCRQELEGLLDFPPRHARHQPHLDAFWRDGESYDKSVFIMTKFPGLANDAKDDELRRVLDSVQDAVRRAGHVPRIASDKRYHPGLWDNVELYLLACRQGIAVVEDRYLPELNPNVTMEWGWMRAYDKRVLYLVEEKFGSFRADVGGLIQDSFDWDDPEPGVCDAVARFLC